MRPRMVPIGFGNLVHTERIIAMVVPDSAPVRRLVSDARDRGMLIDATQGRRTRAVIIADSGHVILSAVNPETVAARMEVDEDGNGRGPANRGCV